MHKRSTFRSAPPFFVPLLKLELLFIQTVVTQCKLSTPLQLSSGTGNNQITQVTKSPSVSFHGANRTSIVAAVVVEVAPVHVTKVEVNEPCSLRTMFNCLILLFSLVFLLLLQK